MEKKTIIAILLSVVVWILWFMLFPQPEKKKIHEVQTTQDAKKESEKKSVKPEDIKTTNIASPIKLSRPVGGQKADEIKVETEKYKITLSSKGASIKSVIYKDKNIEVVVNDSPYQTKKSFDFPIHFSDYEFLNGNALQETVWMHYKSDNSRIRFYTTLTLNGSPVQIEKIFTFPEKGYSFNVEYKLINRGRKDISLSNGNIYISPSDMVGPTLDYSNTYNSTISGIYALNGEFEQIGKGGGSGGLLNCLSCSSQSGPRQETVKESGNINWIGIMSRYLLVIMVPEGFSGNGVLTDNRSGTGFRTGLSVNLNSIKAGEEVKKKFKVYIGEKNKDKLRSVDKSIVDAADISKWIEPIRYFVLWFLNIINSVVGNYGWALVIFSLVSKIVFLPLTKKSTESMKKMQALSPKIKELKAKHKDKPDVLQKETMKLYKENSVNPMGGCLPMLLQMPFFFALYSALINSIDLWQAPFILWINDLSMPDTIMSIRGFNINILPLLMTVSSILQQKLTTADTGQQQQKMMTMMMPIFLLFIFWNMPSGLVLYWTLQNVFQVAHQVFVNKREKPEEK